MVADKERYDNVAIALNIPWNFIAIIHCMEGSLSFNKHLHNGDSLTARTIHIPKGRPVKGNPPFSWEESGFTTKNDWSIPGMLSYFEVFNGMGYRKKALILLIYGVIQTTIQKENLLRMVYLIQTQSLNKWVQQFY